MARKNRQDWIEAGFNILTLDGARALTVDALTNHLKMTKGSFYHHFRGFDDYITKLMTDFEDRSTHNVIHLMAEGGSAAARLQRLSEISTGFPPGLEIAIRAWALINPKVKAFQVRIDQRRVDYVEGLYFELVGDPERARLMAEMMYALWIGGMHLMPHLDEKRAYHHLNELSKLFDTPFEQGKRPNESEI